MKRILARMIAIALLLGLGLAACGGASTGIGNGAGNGVSSQPAGSSASQALKEDAPAHAHLMALAEEQRLFAETYAEEAMPSLAAYYYGAAGAALSSLRYAVDNILWLKGEGETLADVVGVVRYSSWEQIAEIGFMSHYPLYYQALLMELQGKEEEAAALYEKAAWNPAYAADAPDFYYLRNMSVEDLYALQAQLRGAERTLYAAYKPKSRLLDTYTGGEFMPEYHMILAEQALDGETADYARAFGHYQNALAADPFSLANYGFCFYTGTQSVGNFDAAAAYLNEGLWIAPNDPGLNLLAGAAYIAAGDMVLAEKHLGIMLAYEGLPEEYHVQAAALQAKMGG